MARLGAAGLALVTGQDVNTAIQTATIAVENNFCLTIMPVNEVRKRLGYELPDNVQMTPETEEQFRTDLERNVSLVEKELGRPLAQEQYDYLAGCALDHFIEDGARMAAGHITINAGSIPGEVLQKMLVGLNLTTEETARIFRNLADRVVFFGSLATSASTAAVRSMSSITSGPIQYTLIRTASRTVETASTTNKCTNVY